jgi:signal transduction histidine kinase
MSVLSSLTNRIFIASALLVIASIAVPVYFVNEAVNSHVEAELQRGLDEAALLVDEYGRTQFETFVGLARAVADLPKLKAAVAEDDPPTTAPIAHEYEQQIQADLFVVTSKSGRLLASVGTIRPQPAMLDAMLSSHISDHESTWFWLHSGAVLKMAAIPLLLPGPDWVGTLVVGFRLDEMAQRIKDLTRSDIVIVAGSEIATSTLDSAQTAGLTAMAHERGVFNVRLAGEDFIGRVQPLGASGEPVALVLRSRTAQTLFLRNLHRDIAVTGVVAILVATLLGYAIARTVTRPVRALTATMREVAATGNLAGVAPAVRPTDDEDARLLATSFTQLTTALDRFQREAAQKERLSSLGRLSTVIAHEVRNPLMIIKAALRNLRRHVSPDVVDVADNIDEEVSRINRVVTGVLDFARPIHFDVAPADLVELCRDAAQAAQAASGDVPMTIETPTPPAPIVTDAERLRSVLVNVLVNAQQAVQRSGRSHGTAPPIALRASRVNGGRWCIEVADRGPGIPLDDLPRLFEPFFTTRRTGSGLGLALARNVVEGLGGSITVESQVDVGTTVRIEMPERPAAEAATSRPDAGAHG